MAYKYLLPSQVTLDPENPRLPDGTSSDREAINRLLDDGAEALVSLARDMAQTGQTNPAELPIAIKAGSKYLILEGNRRFAALKLLRDPALADNEAHQKAFRRAAALGNPPKNVFTLVADSREQAEHWIVLRHTGENNGRGVKRWSAGQTATHRRRANRTVDSGTLRSIAIADELEEAYAADTELIELIQRTRREKLTNIGRFFSSDVMDSLYFTLPVDENSSLGGRVLMVRHTRESLRDFFLWAFTYIAKNSVDAYKNSKIRSKALLTVPDLLPKPTEASAEPFRLTESALKPSSDSNTSDSKAPSDNDGESGREEGGSQPNTGTNGHGNSSSSTSSTTTGAQGNGTQQTSGSQVDDRSRTKPEAKPEKFLFQGLKLPNHPGRIQQLLKECRSLEIDEFPSTACVMVRILVELSVSSRKALALSGSREGDTLKNKIMGVLKYLDPDIEHARRRDKELEQAFVEASDLGIQYLNAFVHNPAFVPDPHLARRFSTAFRPLLKRVDEAL